MRIEISLPGGAARPPGGAGESLYALLARLGGAPGRVVGQASPGVALVSVAGRLYSLPTPGQSFAAGTLLALSAHATRENVIFFEPAPGAPPRMDAGGLEQLLARLELPATPLHRGLARVLLTLGLPVDAPTLSALAAALPGFTPQQAAALQYLLGHGLPVSDGILALVESWFGAGHVPAHLAEILAGARRGRAADALAGWILELGERQAERPEELVEPLRRLFSPFQPPSAEAPTPRDLPASLQELLAESGSVPRGEALLAQLRAVETLSAQAGAGGALLFPLFLNLAGEPAVAWARLEGQAGGRSDAPAQPLRFSLALTLAQLGPMQIDFLLAGESLSLWFFFAEEAAVGQARRRLPELAERLAGAGFSLAGLEALRAAGLPRDLLQETLGALLSSGDPPFPRLEVRA